MCCDPDRQAGRRFTELEKMAYKPVRIFQVEENQLQDIRWELRSWDKEEF